MHEEVQPTRRQIITLVSLYWLAIVACTVLPWVFHFAIGWWAGLLLWILLVAIYDWLFVPRGSICMGVLFGLPLASFLALLLLDGVLLLSWVIAWIDPF
jgi:hypothetical protein